jgi:dTDP-4-dehydrorhamnose 3,5-epimerase
LTSLPPERDLLPGVRVRFLEPHEDERGRFMEAFRESWDEAKRPVQWNVVESRAGVLRGVHVHVEHDDHLLLVRGRASIGLSDLRRQAPAEASRLLELRGDRPCALTIPHGVAHGFYFHEPSLHIYAVTHYWNPEDELACHWRDPELGIPWPVTEAALSRRDAEAPALRDVRAQLRAKGL